MSERTKILSRKQTIDALRYIANSPPPEHGGFSDTVVSIAKSALKWMGKKVMK